MRASMILATTPWRERMLCSFGISEELSQLELFEESKVCSILLGSANWVLLLLRWAFVHCWCEQSVVV